jgi:hypothetical protein
MADTNYQPKVYHKRGGDELVIADGSTLTMEDGAAVTIEDGSQITVESGGEIEIESGATLDLNTGADFYTVDESNTPEYIRNLLLSFQTVTQYYVSGAVAVANVSQMSPAYGHHIFSASTALTTMSVTLPAPDSGCILWMNGSKLVANANVSVLISGYSIVNQGSVILSSFELSALGYAKLICHVAGQWAIVEANINEHTIV